MSDSEESKHQPIEEKKDEEEDNQTTVAKPSVLNFAAQKKESDLRYKQINVDSGAAPGLSNHFPTIMKALEAASPNTVVKITSGNYRENVKITKPNITLEPKEKCGEVTIVSDDGPCLTIDLPEQSDICILNSIKI